jgi:hypothetical protein
MQRMMSAVVLLVLLPVLAYGWFPGASPAYCAQDMQSRYIPPLTADEISQVTELKQVQVMIRHGARTPYGLLNCWKDYNVTWNNCNVTEVRGAASLHPCIPLSPP